MRNSSYRSDEVAENLRKLKIRIRSKKSNDTITPKILPGVVKVEVNVTDSFDNLIELKGES